MKTITIIDTFGFFFRSYFALPPLRNSEGFPTGLLTGFINLIYSLRRDHPTDYIVFALDSKGKTFRNQLYPEYKAHRDPAPEDLIRQLPIAIEWIEKMGFANLCVDGYEADDIITTITKMAKERGIFVRIVSHDKDLYQLIEDGKVVMVDVVKKRDIDERACMEKFGVSPRDFTNYQAIVGDSSDNIPGVKGIGAKGAATLINEFHTLEKIYENIGNVGIPRIQKLLLESKEMAFLSRELVTMSQDAIKECNFETFEYKKTNHLAVLIEDFKHYEMKQALQKAQIPFGITTEQTTQTPTPEPQLAFEAITLHNREDLFATIDAITTNTIVSFDTETTGLDTKVADMVGFSFSFDEQRAYYVPIKHSYLGVSEQIDPRDARVAIEKLMHHKIVGQNLKFDLSLLYRRYDFAEINPHSDTMLLAWLLNPGTKVGLDTLAKKFFKYDMKPFKELVKKGEDFSTVSIEEASFYAAEDAWMTRMLYFALQRAFDLASMTHLLDEAKNVEYPFINLLIRLEGVGIRVNCKKLESLQIELSQKIEELTLDIYALTGNEFNIKSTQQLGIVLFQQLGLKGGKKTKTAYSTDETVLLTLVKEHPVIDKILQYREYQKILSTYVIPLLKLANENSHNRIYTSFLQTGTATGRLSSKDPNLQNIPVKSSLGRSVREAFIPKDGYKLVSIDYSQIELRLLAHYSQDRALMDAFINGEDIHLATSLKLFGPKEAKKKRNFAKSINFGLLYGMGSKKLSEELHITTVEAKEIIANYFASFPTVKNYLEGIQESVKRDGFVETLLKRRRIFNYEGANSMQKAAFLRESVNAVFQGSAADIIKLSMLEIDAYIIEEKLEAHMLLQIHDELIFEIEESQAEEVAKKFATIMQNIIPLKVPLECSVSIGNSWGELK